MSSEEDEVRSLLTRHRLQIIREFEETKLVAILVSKGVFTTDDEDQINSEVDCGGKCDLLIEFIAKNGFDKFRQFCYAIEQECSQLIEDLINDRLSCGDAGGGVMCGSVGRDADVITKMDDINQDEISTYDQRSTSCTGSLTPTQMASSRCSSLIASTSSTPIQSLSGGIGGHTNNSNNNNNNNTATLSTNDNDSNNTYSSLLCHQSSASASPVAVVKKRTKLRHRFSDLGSLGRTRKEKRNGRNFHSMTEALEVLADPVIEDENVGDRTSWEYHTVSVTRVPGYGFGIAVSGGRDNPHFANGDPSIAVSDVLKGGPAEERLRNNDRIISVNGVSLENVEYATAVQVLRDSGNTVTLVIRRRVPNLSMIPAPVHSHQHSQSLSSTGLGGAGTPQQTIKLVLTKANKKEDFGIMLGCRLFIKEISSKARDQLIANGYSLQEGDIVTRIHNTNCNDGMSLKEAKKIIDGCKERLNLVVLRDVTNLPSSTGMQGPVYSHTAQVSNCSNVDDNFLAGGSSYSAQNLYVQPPTRPAISTLLDDKSNLTPRGRSRGPLMDVSLSQLDRPSTPPPQTSASAAAALANVAAAAANRAGILGIDEPPRPPPPRGEDFYSSRRQLYEEDALLQRAKQSSEPRFISFQKEGSVGIRLTGGNEAGIFVTAVQPGSPASLQGLTPGDKILKVNDMDMHGVTREEAVLFLLSLQDRIDLIVQHCKDEYDNVVANKRGDSFHIKTHFHCENPSKGEMSFKAGDVFRVIDTLHNGVVGSWLVLRIGRGHQELQRGVIPNKSRAEELATAQFNATKKEMNASESRGSFFKRRRSTHRRSKSLSRENWDDVVFSDSISKFPAYERVVLRHPGFVRPVVLFGPVADLARERLIKDFPDKFTAPLQDSDKTNTKCGIVRLSNIRDIMDRGKHALLDITPNAVDRLNYAQFYPIVIFLKADTKHMIKQLRQGIPKSAHKSSKKLLEQCQKLERVWSHIFSTSTTLNDTETWYRKLREGIDMQQSGAVWMSESKPVESLSDDFLFPMTTSRLSYASSPESDLELSPGPSASLSLGNLPQLVKSSSDPSIATNQDNLERDRELNIGEGMPPPYTNPYDHNASLHTGRRPTVDSKYGFSPNGSNNPITSADSSFNNTRPPPMIQTPQQSIYSGVPELPPRVDRASKPPGTQLTPTNTTTPTTATGLRNAAGTMGRSAQERLFGSGGIKTSENGGSADPMDDYGTRANLIGSPSKRGSEHSLERTPQQNNTSLDRLQQRNSGGGVVATTNGTAVKNNGSYDSVSSYDSCNTTQLSMQNLRLGPNAPDDLKSVPNANGRQGAPTDHNAAVRANNHMHSDSIVNRSSLHEHSRTMSAANDLNRQNSPGRPSHYGGDPHSRNISMDNRNHEMRPAGITIPQRPSNLGFDATPPRKHIVETKTDYGKYSRNNSASQADYAKSPKSPQQQQQQQQPPSQAGPPISGAPFKPVPPPKPKNYRPPMQGGQMSANQWENGQSDATAMRSPNGFFYPPTPSHYHHTQANPQTPPDHMIGSPNHQNMHYRYPGGGNGGNYNNGSNHQGGSSYPNGNGGGVNGQYGTTGANNGQYNMHRNEGNFNHHPSERHGIDLVGSRERGSAFELYRKPQIGTAGHHHNMSEMMGQYPSTSAMMANEINERQMYSNTSMHHQSHHPQLPPGHPAQHRGIGGGGGSWDEYNRPQSSPPPPPPPPPLKPKSKLLKSPLAAIKNAFLKSTKPLRRQSSLADGEKKVKPILRRQHSMMEQRNILQMRSPPDMQQHNMYHNMQGGEHHHHQQQQQQQQQMYGRDGYMHEPYYHPPNNNKSGGTYQNLEMEAMYGNSRLGSSRHAGSNTNMSNYNNEENLYANRAFIELERNAAQRCYGGASHMPVDDRPPAGGGGGQIVRRHSMADRATSTMYNNRREAYMMQRSRHHSTEQPHQVPAADDIYQTRSGAFMMRNLPPSGYHRGNRDDEYGGHHSAHNQQRRNSDQNEPIYTSRRDMHRDHLYQSKKEMQERIMQGRREVEQRATTESPGYVSRREILSQGGGISPSSEGRGSGGGGGESPIYQSRRDMKENNFRTRSQLRDQIYQTRREAMESMAEPVYVSKRELKQETIFESKESMLDETVDTTAVTVNDTTNDETDNTESPMKAAPMATAEEASGLNSDEDDTLTKTHQSDSPTNALGTNSNAVTLPLVAALSSTVTPTESTTSTAGVSSLPVDTKSSNTSSPDNNQSTTLISSPMAAHRNFNPDNGAATTPPPPSSAPTKSLADATTVVPMSPRVARAPFHISNIIKRTAPPPISESMRRLPNNVHASRTSIETQYTSQASLPIGPPNAQSTPYASEMSLPNGGGGVNSQFQPPLRQPSTTRGVFDACGGTLCDNIWNVSLNIPPGAIPAGIKQEIYFTVTDPRLSESVGGPPLDMENGETMLSPLVMCGPQGLEFRVPVTLNIPHCAGRTTSLGLALKATDSESNLQTNWDNIELPSNTAAHTVSVKVDHF